MKKILQILLSVLVFFGAFTRLAAQGDDSRKLLETEDLLGVYVTLPADTLNWILGNPSSDMEHYASVRLQNSLIDTLIGPVGFRLRGNTSRNSQKKSFKISFDAWEPGRECFNLTCLNLNGEHNDPSIVRSKLCFDLMREAGMKVSRAHHARLYINGAYFGLYMLVENIDKEFLKKKYADPEGNLWKCLYPADLTYKGTNPDLYRNLNDNGRPAYELKTNKEENSFTDLARFIRVINMTSSSLLRDSLERISNPAEFLQYFAMNNLLGSWDEYWSLMNNYYLYYEPSQERMHLIPYDYDNTFGVNWFSEDWARSNPYVRYKVSSGSRPLAEKLLAVDAYRDLYTHFLEFYNDRLFALPYWEDRLDASLELIAVAASEDQYRTFDWGFTYADFLNSFTEGPYSNQHVKYGIREFVTTRNTSLPIQLQYKETGPIVYELDFFPKRPRANDPVRVQVSAFSPGTVASVSLYLTREGSGTQVEYPLSFSPVLASRRVEEADRWETVLPPLGEGGKAEFYVEANDVSAHNSRYPLGRSFVIETLPTIAKHLVINEFMAGNSSYFPDQNGEYDDWLELYNPTGQAVLLSGMYLTDSKNNRDRWRFRQEGLYLDPGEYLTVWCDSDTSQEGYHTNFRLSASGEFIGLVTPDGKSFVDSISFGLQQFNLSMGQYPNASVYTGIMPASLNASNNQLLTRIFQNANEPSWRVYPNPFSDQLFVKFDQHDPAPAAILITDMLGRQVYRKDFSPVYPLPSVLSIPVEHLTDGVYTAVFMGKEGSWTRKIIRVQ